MVEFIKNKTVTSMLNEDTMVAGALTCLRKSEIT